jgi:hypothetical protein
LSRTRPTWVFTVVSPTNRAAAISALVSPRAIASSTSRSRAVSASSAPGRGALRAGALANSSIRRRVTEGDSSASPPATTRMAATSSSGGVSFSRNPLAPPRRASNTYSSRSNVVRISTLAVPSRVIRRVASIPSTRGMRMSMSTTSGASRAAC